MIQNRKKAEQSEPYAIVVLGGGLTLDKKGKGSGVNNYSALRLKRR